MAVSFRRGDYNLFSAGLPLDYYDRAMRIQSECDHAILANSAFAWWGAWLGDRRHERGRTVIAPSGWGGRVRERWYPLEEVPGVATPYDLWALGPNAALQ